MTRSTKISTVSKSSKKIGFLSDVGKKRQVDEDAIIAVEYNTVFESKIKKKFLLVVADGMGGHARGEVASNIVASAIAENMSQPIISNSDYASDIKKSILTANKKIIDYTVEHPDSSGMGSTVVCAIVDGNHVHLGSVGDSRAYVISKEEIRQVTKDHSFVQELIDKGEITSEEAISHPRKNVITRAVGAYSEVEVDTMKLTLLDDEFLLLCCDGLIIHVNDDEIKDIVTNTDDVQETCKKLVDLANERGGKDNISVIIFG
jgi:protein phosphatase